MILTYDLETTGLPVRSLPVSHEMQPRIVQIGAIMDYEDGREAMRIDLVLRHHNLPEETIKSWHGAAKIHGIEPDVSYKIGVEEATAMDAFLDMVQAADTIVGQNIKGFDNDIIRGTVRRLHKNDTLDPFDRKGIYDTMLAAQPVCRIPARNGGLKRPNLTEIHTYLFGTGFEDAHTAIADVLACRRCYYELKRRAQEKFDR